MIEDVRVFVERPEDLNQPVEGIVYHRPVDGIGRIWGTVKIQYLILGEWRDAKIVFAEGAG